MIEERSVSYEFLLEQYNATRNDIWRSKVKTLAELLASSLLVFLWAQSQLMFDMPYSFRFLAAFPIILNATAWLFWSMSRYLFQFRHYFPDRSEREYQEPEMRDLYDQHQFALSALRRISRVERFVDFATALQFVTIAIHLTSTHMIFR